MRPAGGGMRAGGALSPGRSAGYRSPGRSSPSRSMCASSCHSPPREVFEVIHLKEEKVHLRECNVNLREQELAKRRELEDLARTRAAIAAEVKQLERSRVELQEQKNAEQVQLEKQHEIMKE